MIQIATTVKEIAPSEMKPAVVEDVALVKCVGPVACTLSCMGCGISPDCPAPLPVVEFFHSPQLQKEQPLSCVLS